MNKIILVCGPICSGKTTWCNSQIRENIDSYLKVSEVVRKVSNASTRVELQGTKHFDIEIADLLIEAIYKASSTSQIIYVDGIRQTSILQRVLQEFEKSVEIVWLEEPFETRKSRYQARADARDAHISFEKVEKRDNELGLSELKQYILQSTSNHQIK